MKEGTLDRKQEYFSPMTEQFELKQNSFDYNLSKEDRKLSREFSGNKNLQFKELAPANQPAAATKRNSRQVRFVSFENQDVKVNSKDTNNPSLKQ